MTTTLDRNRGISTTQHSFFNTDGKKHEFIENSDAKELFSFKVLKEQDYRPNGTPITGHYHLIRKDNDEDDGVVIGNIGVGSEFNVDSQPIDALNFMLDEICPKVPELKLETVSCTDNGATTFANFTFGEPWELPGDTSPHNTKFMYVNPLTRGTIKLLSHTIRIVCQNTLAQACKTGEGFRISHTGRSQYYVTAALDAIKAELENAAALKNFSMQLANTNISSKQMKDILDKVYPLKQNKKGEDSSRITNIRNAAMEQFEKDKTFTDHNAWAFLNALTYGVQHPTLTKTRTGSKVELDNLFGARAAMKSKMLNATLDEFGLLVG